MVVNLSWSFLKSGREAVEKASELFPDHAYMFYGPRGGLIDGNAEAALIAYYGYQMEMKNGYNYSRH
jgi:hypothetical protein